MTFIVVLYDMISKVFANVGPGRGLESAPLHFVIQFYTNTLRLPLPRVTQLYLAINSIYFFVLFIVSKWE